MGTAHNILLFAALDGEANTEKRRYVYRLQEEVQALGGTLHAVDLLGKLEDPGRHVAPLRPAGQAGVLQADPVYVQAVRWHAMMREESIEAAERHLGGFVCECLRTIEEVRPGVCVLWNQFTPLNHVLASVCLQRSIPVVFGHLGLLPGTVVLETGGQMGESWVARENARFLNLPVDAADLVRVEKYLECARGGQWTRKPQGDADALRSALAAHPFGNRKRLFYAGQNDFASGMLPAELSNARLHSPCFRDTEDALRFLAEFAEERDLLVIFKPHPSMKKASSDADAWQLERVLTLPGANVFACMEAAEVTVTILSQVAYQALIQERPALLLGHMQLNGKGCIYEADSREQACAQLDCALLEGFTAAQRDAWRRHAAQLMRCYLFPLTDEMADLTGRPVTAAAEYIMQTIEPDRGVRPGVSQQDQEPAGVIEAIAAGCTRQGQSYRQYMERTKWRVEADYEFLLKHTSTASSILDLGAVPPLLAGLLKQHFAEVAIADPEAELFAPFCQNHGILFSRANLLLGDDPFPGRQFDLVCLCEVLEHLSGDLLTALDRVVAKTAPGGFLFVTTPNLRSITGLAALLRHGSGIPSKMTETVRAQYERAARQGGYLGHVREYSAREVIDLFESFGLEHLASGFQTHPRTPTLEKKVISIIENLFPSWRLYGKYLFRKRLETVENPPGP